MCTPVAGCKNQMDHTRNFVRTDKLTPFEVCKEEAVVRPGKLQITSIVTKTHPNPDHDSCLSSTTQVSVGVWRWELPLDSDRSAGQLNIR